MGLIDYNMIKIIFVISCLTPPALLAKTTALVFDRGFPKENHFRRQHLAWRIAAEIIKVSQSYN